MKKKMILLSLISVLSIFAGCSLDGTNKIEEDTTSSERVQEDVQEEADEETGEELKESVVPENDESTNIEENENSAVISDDGNNNIEIKDATFITQMDEIYKTLDSYIGKTIKVEGFIADIEENNFKLLRLYDMLHINHYHEVTVGINAVYEGEIPAEDSWVEITGTIGSKNIDGEETPIVNVTRLEKKFTEGQKKVYN